MNDIVLEKECNRIIKEFNLSRKEWTNAKTILKGMFTYAIRKKYLKEGSRYPDEKSTPHKAKCLFTTKV